MRKGVNGQMCIWINYIIIRLFILFTHLLYKYLITGLEIHLYNYLIK
jgi:hypothetical protein